MENIHYFITAHNPHAHLWRVELHIASPKRGQTVSLPVWIPGSYMVREFSQHLQHLSATQGKQSVAVQQLDKCSWKLACNAGEPLVLSYEVYALDNSVRTAWLDAQRAFFNPTSLCLRVHGQEDSTHSLHLNTINLIANYAVFSAATAIKGIKKGFKSYSFANFDELADTPFEINAGWSGSFKVRGVEHVFCVSGAPPAFDGERLLLDTKKIVEQELCFWHGDKAKPPFKRYVFMLNAVDDGYGGLEHRASTALICSRKDLPRKNSPKQSEGYTTLLGLISHEYFHTWNVKRLKPKEFLRYDYVQENYTELLWFFEGFTSYYDDLLLRRAGLLDNTQYMRLLCKTINQVQQTPGRFVQSVAQASMDAWVKYYRQTENTANATVSYYTKGSLVALCLDLELRKHGKSLDEVMRRLYARHVGDKEQGGITEADIARALQEVSGQSFTKQLATWVHSCAELPLAQLLAEHGAVLMPEVSGNAAPAQRLGLRVSESNGISIKTVLRGGSAELAGLAAGDELLGINGWRLTKLDDIALYAAPGEVATLLISRDKQLQELQLSLPGVDSLSIHNYSLRGADNLLVNKWLEG